MTARTVLVSTWTDGIFVFDRTVPTHELAATADGAPLLANVHVGGIPRSTDGGVTWHPTIAVDADVHEVRAHPRRANVVMAAWENRYLALDPAAAGAMDDLIGQWITYRVAMGPRSGQKVFTLQSVPAGLVEEQKRGVAEAAGF